MGIIEKFLLKRKLKQLQDEYTRVCKTPPYDLNKMSSLSSKISKLKIEMIKKGYLYGPKSINKLS